MDLDHSPTEATISQLNLVLLWPLHVQGPSNVDEDRWVARCASVLQHDERWQPIKDTYSHGRTQQQAYAELVYLHPFVQRFLYPAKAAQAKSPTRVFERTDIQRLRVDLGCAGDRELGIIEFHVPRLQLHLFDLQIAILVCELTTAEVQTIAIAQTILDRVRRAYPPYWARCEPPNEQTPGESVGGHCPRSCMWLPKVDGHTAAIFGDPVPYLDFAEQHRSPPIAAHWKQALAPLAIEGDPQAGEWTLRQVEDDRIPLMAHISVSHPRLLTRGDFARLTFADEAGSSESQPYASAFLENFEDRYCYDRHWGSPEEPDWMTTRYLCAGYTFIMVGDAKPNGFFLDGDSGGLSHFRHHYLQMGLIAHFHRAALLMIADQLSDAIDRSLLESDEFRARSGAILKRLLRFTHRYWFNEISNQIQARELFAWWSRHLETHKLYDQVKEEARGINEFLDTREQERQTRFTTRLTAVATLGIALAISASLLPMIAIPGLKEALAAHWRWALAGLVAISLMAVWLLYLLSGWLAPMLTRHKSKGD